MLWVRVTCGEKTVSAEAFGVGNRRPRVTRITLARAAALSAAGIPCLIRQTAG